MDPAAIKPRKEGRMTEALQPKRSDKCGTLKARKSLPCDGSFVADLLACGYFARVDAAAYPLVGRRIIRRSPLTLPISSYPMSPKAWRDTHDDVRGLFYAVAIRKGGNVRKFDLNLSQEVETLARDQGKHCLAWLHRRVVRQLRRVLGASTGIPTPFWFATEESDKGRLHIHGEIAFEPHREKLIRKALKTAGGAWADESEEYQLVLRISPNLRGAGYCLKSYSKARPDRRRNMQRYGSPRSMVAGFEGKAVTASENLKRAAIECHSAAVAEVVRFRSIRPVVSGRLAAGAKHVVETGHLLEIDLTNPEATKFDFE
jgi:hypothetical protein